MSAKARRTISALEPRTEPNRPNFFSFIAKKDAELHQRFSDAVRAIDTVMAFLDGTDDVDTIDGKGLYSLLHPHTDALEEMDKAIDEYHDLKVSEGGAA